jgi:transcriptional regulator with XRE-family HTH domain
MASLPLLLHRLGQVIRTLRTQAGYSQERFGFAIGVHRTYMGHLERGTANPTVKILHFVAQGLGISVSDLLTLAMTEDSAGTHAPEAGWSHLTGSRGEEREGRQATSQDRPTTTTNLQASVTQSNHRFR